MRAMTCNDATKRIANKDHHVRFE
jgi:hypothetical protein